MATVTSSNTSDSINNSNTTISGSTGNNLANTSSTPDLDIDDDSTSKNKLSEKLTTEDVQTLGGNSTDTFRKLYWYGRPTGTIVKLDGIGNMIDNEFIVFALYGEPNP